MRLKYSAFAALSVLGVLSLSGVASASSHREAPAISTDPAADNTDVYAWVCGSPKALCIVANYNPLELPEGGPNYNKFSDDVLYQIHVTHNDDAGIPSLVDYMTFDVFFSSAPIKKVGVDDKKAAPGGGKEFFAQIAGEFNQTATVYQRVLHQRIKNNGKDTGYKLFENAKVAPPNIGQRTSTFAYGNPSYDAVAKPSIINADGYKFFAGPRDDAFYVNLSQIFDLGAFVGLNALNGKPFRTKVFDVDPAATGTFANTDPKKALDGVAGLNVHTIALAIPLTELTLSGDEPEYGKASNASLFGVWASASRRTASCYDPNGRGLRRSDGPWKQVSRLGLPLINEAVIGLQDKDSFNAQAPSNDVKNFGAYFLNPIIVRDIEAVGGYAQLGISTVPDDFKYGRVDILNVVNLKDIPAAGAHNVPIENGRTGDVLHVDIALDPDVVGFPNGRPLSGAKVASGKEEDITDVIFSLFLSKLTVPIPDGVGGPGDGRKLLTVFPYLAPPFAGDSEGRGKPAVF